MMMPPLVPVEKLCRPFSLAEILSATHGFDESLIIGKGGFGQVYKGVIDDGANVVAIKRLDSTSKQGESEFRNEIEMLSKFRHSHIVSLIGYCYSPSEMILIYEYMSNGSLADHLYKIYDNVRTGCTLSWVQRLKICLGAARGIDYLHTGTCTVVEDGVIHRDVKSSNILLDERWVARVSDFGLSKSNPCNQSYARTNVKGTARYLDPEYALTLKLRTKSDVYSFGVVLFEVLCGMRVRDLTLNSDLQGLAGWVSKYIEEGTLHRIIDSNLRWEILPNSLTKFVEIAHQCLCYQSKNRPTMTQVVAALELALALQLGSEGSFSNEMEILDNQENVDFRMVQQGATKFGNGSEHSVKIMQPRVIKPFRKMLQSLIFCVPREASGNTLALGLNNTRAIRRLNNSVVCGESGRGFTIKVPQGLSNSSSPPSLLSTTRRQRLREFRRQRSGTSSKHADRKAEEFMFSDLAAATNNFSWDNKIGTGSFGIVYKGKLLDGQEVAIKRGETASSKMKKFLREKESRSAFDSELASLSRVHHKNLVRLVGFCESRGDEERLLVYEYMKNEGLYHRLHDKNNVEKSSSPLNSWKMRIKISFDAARGIEYLHNYAVPPIIHRDIKSSNILLDANWTARVSDFGLSILIGPTVGYIDPEYYGQNVLTTESDVYSLGVVLLEILTGKMAIFKTGENGGGGRTN
ncbi:hypothetical protein LguiA_030851 [Lonicera macranthoides]